MKALKKLALVSAVSMISAGAFAMEAMDDESMSSATGRDGVLINVLLPTIASADSVSGAAVGDGTIYGLTSALVASGAADPATATPADDFMYKGIIINQVKIHDTDGTTGTGLATISPDGGAIVIGNGTAADSTVVYEQGLPGALAPIVIEIDTTGDANNNGSAVDAMLNVKITLPTLHIKMGAVYVANSVGGAGAAHTTDNMSAAIMNGSEIVLGASVMNIQLANENQGSMIALNTTLTGGLALNNVSLNDVAGTWQGGSIAMSSMTIKDSGGANLTLGVGIDASNGANPLCGGFCNGLRVALNSFGTTAVAGIGGADIVMNRVVLGATGTASLGDVEILGLQLANTALVIRGK